MNSTAKWPELGEIYNNATGILTSFNRTENNIYDSGDMLYSVDLKPIILIEGDVPAFRTMKKTDKGDDIRALQLFLHEQGFYGGKSDGSFGPKTESAVKIWQKASGYPATGQLDLGDVIFIDAMPTRLSLDVENKKVGQSVGGGEPIARVLSSQPHFEIALSNQQAATVEIGTKVEILDHNKTWEAQVAGKNVSKENAEEITLELESFSEEPICGSCNTVRVGENSLYPTSIIVQERIEGLLAPTAAIYVDNQSNNYVLGANGEKIPAKILGSVKAKSIISGPKEGTIIRLTEGNVNE